MKRLPTTYVLLLMFSLMMLGSVSRVAAEESQDVVNATVIGVVKLDKAGVTPTILKQVDRLVPAIKKMSTDKIVKLDCRYMGKTNRESDVRAAYSAASRIEKYLREHHKLKLDLWITAQLHTGKRDEQKLVFSVFKDEFR